MPICFRFAVDGDGDRQRALLVGLVEARDALREHVLDVYLAHDEPLVLTSVVAWMPVLPAASGSTVRVCGKIV
jgi:hypothetical protein